MNKQSFDLYLDRDDTQVYKGMATLLIIFCHFMGKFGNGIVIFTPLGGIGVSIFLVLSAYGLNESWNSLVLFKAGGGIIYGGENA